MRPAEVGDGIRLDFSLSSNSDPGIQYWFSAAFPAVVGDVRRGHRLLAGVAQHVPATGCPEACRDFELFANSQR